MRLAIASYRPLIRGLLAEALGARCGAEGILQFESAEALAAAAEQLLDTQVIVIDAPSFDSWSASLEIVLRRAPRCRAVVLTAACGDYIVNRAAAFGVAGLVHETDGVEDLVTGVELANRGGVFTSPGVVERRSKPAVLPLLTERELQVLRLACRGLSDEDAGAELGLAPSTIESHRTNVLRKLSIADWAELLIVGLRLGVVSLEEIQFSPNRRRSAMRGRR